MKNRWDKMVGNYYKVCFEDGTDNEKIVTGIVDYFDGERLVILTEDKKER